LDLNIYVIPTNAEEVMEKNKGKMISKESILGVFSGVFGYCEHITSLHRSTPSYNAEHHVLRLVSTYRSRLPITGREC